MNKGVFSPDDVLLVSRVAEDARRLTLGLGEIVILNSGGPMMMVVDTTGNEAVVAWKCGETLQESCLPTICLRRATQPSIAV